MDTAEMSTADIKAERQARIRERYRIIGCKIAYYRRLKGYTQAELAKRCNVTANYLSQIECGKRENYPLGMLMMISDALNVEMKTLCE